MAATLTIGDFARATHMSVKALRYYHRVGLLEPADVDPATGYRRYTTDQIPTAQVIRRFRHLDMPVEEIRAVIAAPDLNTRNALIAAHLTRLKEDLARSQRAVAVLNDLLQHPPSSATADITHRTIDPIPSAAISEVIDIEDATAWYQGAVGELAATLGVQNIAPTGPPGGIYSSELFAHDRGRATVFIPCDERVAFVGRVTPLVVPAIELATTVHVGPPSEVDRAYGTLATYVAERAIAVEGPLRECYLVGRYDTLDESRWRTEIGWPIFRTGGHPSDHPDRAGDHPPMPTPGPEGSSDVGY